MISRSEIMKMTCLSKHNLARSAIKNLFTQPLSKESLAAVGGEILFCETHHFPDFAKRNQENDVSHKT